MEEAARVTWKDITTYSQGRERIPTWWTIRIGDLHLSVGNEYFGYEPETCPWFVLCEPWFHHLELPRTLTEAEAKAEAVRLLREKLNTTLALLNKLTDIQI
jgi:hypothetical protein